MKKILLSALALVALASCSKNESIETTTDNWDGELRISSGITTRASGTLWDSGDAIGVFMSNTGTTTAVGTHNTKYITTDEDNATYSTATFTVDSDSYTDLYYPQSGNVDIVAHYPHFDDEDVLVSSYPIDLKNTPIDFMSAKMVDVAKSKTALNLEFYHLLSQINVTLTPADDGGLTATDLATATVTLSGTKLKATAKLSADYDSENNKYIPTATFEDYDTEADLSQTAADSKTSFIIVPQTATVTFTISVSGYGDFYATASDATFSSGDEHNYAISVSRTAAKIEGATINPWGTGTGDSLDASDYVQLDIALEDEVYQIYTAAGLSAFASIVNEGADVSGLNTAGIEDTSIDQNTYAKGQLMNDIDLSTVCYAVDDEGGVSWTPIGKDGASFFGTFDGDNYTISGLYINSTSNYQGLFGYVDSSTIGNVNVEGSVVAASYVGGIVGGKNQYSAVTISNCSYSGSVNGSGDYVGGIIGYSTGNYNCKISNCVNNSTVKADGSYVGGITGYSYSMYGYVQYCGNNGDVTAKTSYAGGISGCNPLGYMRYNYNKGSIAATSYVGGIVGSQYAVGANTSTNGGYSGVTYNYNTGSVTGDSNVGGIVGIIGGYYSIQYCYNSGSVTSNNNSYFGGIYGSYVSSGYGSGTSVTVTNSYYASDKISSSPTYTAGTAILSTEMLDGTFAEKLGSSYQEDVASNINDGYPILVWQVATE